MKNKNMRYENVCNQCGKCCREEVCLLGEIVFGSKISCDALIFEDNKYWCAFVKHGEMIHPDIPDLVIELLGIGQGCDAQSKIRKNSVR